MGNAGRLQRLNPANLWAIAQFLNSIPVQNKIE